VARHAEAKHATVNLKTDGVNLVLSITDDGIGFNPDELLESEGLGVAGMRERAALLGGNLEVSSWEGMGVCVDFRVPIEADHRG
jgi:signal transduction histidine kinase